MATWRKGLRWDKAAGRWREVKSGKLVSDAQLRKRKGIVKKRTAAEVTYDRIKSMLQKAQAQLSERELEGEPIDVSYRIHRNRDGTIDAELKVKPTEDMSVTDVLTEVDEVVKPVPNTFVSTRVRYEPTDWIEASPFDRRFQGMYEIGTNYQRNTRGKLAANINSGKFMDEKATEAGAGAPEQVALRIHWNPDKERPERKK